MNRLALKSLFGHLVLASMPLGAGACNDDGRDGPGCEMVDLAGTQIGGSAAGGVFYRAAPRSYALDGGISSEDCNAICEFSNSCRPVDAVSCGTVVRCSFPVAGRRPPSLQWKPSLADSGRTASAVSVEANYFAQLSHLEAASVFAFVTLRRKLRLHGAPPRLIRDASRAARDEVGHARITAALARELGAEPPRPAVDPTADRGLEEVAIENAVEGCVRETWGALLATWQARAAQDGRARRLFARIAVDETRHAELAFGTEDWAASRLDAAARHRVGLAQAAARAALLDELQVEPHPALRRFVGVPGAATSSALARALFDQLAIGQLAVS